MKTSKFFALVLLGCALTLTLAASAQTYDITATGGILDSSSGVLTLPSSTVIAVTQGQTHTYGNLGSLSLTAPSLASGDLQNGGIIDAGGAFTLTVPSKGIAYSGSFEAGTSTTGVWKLITLANGTHYYYLNDALFTSSQGSGALVVQTVNIGHGLWSGSAAIDKIYVHITLTP